MHLKHMWEASGSKLKHSGKWYSRLFKTGQDKIKVGSVAIFVK